MISRSQSSKTVIINIICALAVMASAFIVRTPSAVMVNGEVDNRAAYMDETGLMYFTDMDSYYHVRLVDEQVSEGHTYDTLEDGEPWDMHSYYPEGRSAVYKKGIVYFTIAVWRFLGLFGTIDLSRVEFSVSVLMAMLTALAAYIAGLRMSGRAGGLTAGLLIGCAPVYVSRTGFGRFDTDMFVVLMNVLLILFLTETLLAKDKRKQIIFAAVFVFTALIYSQCWTPTYSMLFAGLTLLGGLCAVASGFFMEGSKDGRKNEGTENKHNNRDKGLPELIRKRETILVLGSGVLILMLIAVTSGISAVGRIFSALSFKTTADVGEGVLPNLYVSISELKRAAFMPKSFGEWIFGYIPGSSVTVIGGIGGLFAALAALLGLIWLGITAFKKKSSGESEIYDKDKAIVYFCVLMIWMLAGLYLTRSGIRFIEMLSVPAGLLGGMGIGMLFRFVSGFKDRKKIVLRIISVVACLAVMLPAMGGAILISACNVPSATDASANSMKWLMENANDPDAVIESWWDMGYYYESESGHPCLWDGGSQNGVRAILYSTAMTSKDLELSYRILNMLACSGNGAVELMMEHTDARTAFEALWEALMLDKDSALSLLKDKCDMPIDEAVKAEALMHPLEKKEIYLILTYTMTKQMGWYEYYADWDFTGTQELPDATWYSYMPDGTPVFLTEEGQEYLEEKRAGETMWRLFFNAEENDFFTPQYEWHDGVEHVRIWKLEPVVNGLQNTK